MNIKIKEWINIQKDNNIAIIFSLPSLREIFPQPRISPIWVDFLELILSWMVDTSALDICQRMLAWILKWKYHIFYACTSWYSCIELCLCGHLLMSSWDFYFCTSLIVGFPKKEWYTPSHSLQYYEHCVSCENWMVQKILR